ncbi:MAG: di-heme oxidoredictase family protein [Flavobacteriales bacterium]
MCSNLRSETNPMRKHHKTIFIIGLLVVGTAACHKAEPWPDEENEWLSGGTQTIFDNGAGAFSAIFPFISERNEEVHEVGDVAFEQTFVSNGATNPGLGPVYNSVSCTSCHINDGRGTPVGPGPNIISLLFRMSIPGEDVHGGPLAVPGFGGQLQHNAIAGAEPEANVQISYTEQTFTFTDGETYSLRTPVYGITNAYQPLPAGVMFSPRIAPAVFGLGLLEAVSETEVLLYADEYDNNSDGISGRANYVWNEATQNTTLGRFGWKCGAPTLLQQTAGAYHQDMGVTSFLFSEESSAGQTQAAADATSQLELSDSLLHAVAHYVATLAVPGRRAADDEQVLQGKKIFSAAGCANCHRPSVRTATNVAFREVSNQLIFPYTDMLLHDMGEALADNRPDFLATGYEWRTAPLWGIGLTEVVNGHHNFLHDGRARTMLEAVMWHGGEAESAKNHVKNLSAEEREALVAFLESL